MTAKYAQHRTEDGSENEPAGRCPDGCLKRERVLRPEAAGRLFRTGAAFVNSSDDVSRNHPLSP